MDIAGRPLSALILVAALGCARAALAGEPAAMPTAPATASDAPPSVADQIDAYLKASPALALPTEATRGVTSGEDGPRKAHGVVDVAVGSNGYRSAYVRSDVPLGKTGGLSIAVGETRFKGRVQGYWGGYGGPLRMDGESLALGAPGGDGAADPRCRGTVDDGFAARVDRRLDANRPSGCAPFHAPRPAR